MILIKLLVLPYTMDITRILFPPQSMDMTNALFSTYMDMTKTPLFSLVYGNNLSSYIFPLTRGYYTAPYFSVILWT